MSDEPAVLGNDPYFPELIPMVRPWLPQFEELADGVREMLHTGMLTKGTRLQTLEKAMAEHLSVDHVVGVSSCTVGLLLVYIGLGLRGEVVVPSFTFMATVSSLVLAGLKPVFAEINPETGNLDSRAAEAAVTPRTSAIVAVHTFGNPADIAGLREIADAKGIPLIFDAAHGLGSCYRGRPLGNHGAAEVFSLSPTKLVIAGEGGLVATNDGELAEKIRIGREYGHSTGYDSAFAGINGRMPEFNALLARRSLDMLEDAVSHRSTLAGIFHENLESVPGIGFQKIDSRDRSSFKDFSITIDQTSFGLTRNQVIEALRAENIDSRAYYDPPVHLQAAYRRYDSGMDLPHTVRLAEQSLSLPIWSHMPRETALGICHVIERLHRRAEAVSRRLAPK